jgi:hypothetical protein
MGDELGLSVWNEDEAGPFQTIPYPGESWQPEGYPEHQPHEYVRNGTAKLLTLFHPASGDVYVKGVTSSCNAVLHPWLKAELTRILDRLPETPTSNPEAIRDVWSLWQESLLNPVSLPEELPPLRMLLIWDNLKGHHSTEMVTWLVQHGILPLYTPLGGSWLNMAESIQRILVRRGLAGHRMKSLPTWRPLLEAGTRNRHLLFGAANVLFAANVAASENLLWVALAPVPVGLFVRQKTWYRNGGHHAN